MEESGEGSKEEGREGGNKIGCRRQGEREYRREGGNEIGWRRQEGR